MTDTELLDEIENHLYSAFPAPMTTGVWVWMVNLRRGVEIIHGEGPTFRAALHKALKDFTPGESDAFSSEKPG